jgi:L-amino acid N-acyltransferase YncA
MRMATSSSATATDVEVRPAAADDAAALAAIYADDVLHGVASYEWEPPTAAAMAERMAAGHAAGYPWLVATLGGDVAGYAHASAYRTRPGYRWTVEDSVYVAARFRGRGIGARLLDALVRRCTDLGYRQMVAVIGDESNEGSIELHRRAGFSIAARFPGIGRKHGRWLTNVQMLRALGEGSATPPFAEPESSA